jgi:hypothetical protein
MCYGWVDLQEITLKAMGANQPQTVPHHVMGLALIFLGLLQMKGLHWQLSELRSEGEKRF